MWLTNVRPAVVSEWLGSKEVCYGGWINGLYNSLKTRGFNFVFCFPGKKKSQGKHDNDSFYQFGVEKHDYMKYSKRLEDEFYHEISCENPDIIHVFGTEYPYAFAVVKACERAKKLNHTVVNIQGLVSVYSRCFFGDIPANIRYNFTLKEFVRKNNLALQRKDFLNRAKYEIELIKKIKYIIGRTDWDEAHARFINPNVEYVHLEETMRDIFYKEKWEYNKCERYSVFLSQGNYPIKGFHIAIEAFGILIKKFPQIRIKVAGTNILTNNKNIMKKTSYSLYIEKLIDKYKLRNYISFLGELDEKQMCSEYMSANVFISPSSIENSSNSIAEAMLLGTPVVASYVGGTGTMIEDKKEGFLYPFNEPKLLAFYVEKIFSMEDGIETMSRYARERATIRNNPKTNADLINRFYLEIANKSN